MSEITPNFGLWRPLTVECATRVKAAASEARDRVVAYLVTLNNRTPVTVRPDFGYAIASRTAVKRTLQQSGQDFAVASFIMGVNAWLRPQESEQLPIRLARVRLSKSRKPKHVWVDLVEIDPAVRELRADAELAAALAEQFGGVRLPIAKLDHLTLLDCGQPGEPHSREPLLPQERAQIVSIVTSVMIRADLGQVEVGRLVIGTDYREPLPGTEWPPETGHAAAFSL